MRSCEMPAVTICRMFVSVLAFVLLSAAQGIQIDIGPTYVLTGAATAGAINGTFAAATFNRPKGISVTPFDDSILLVADAYNRVVRKIDLRQGTVATWLGVAGVTGDVPGTGSAASMDDPTSLKADPRDPRFLFLAVYYGIRRVNVETADLQPFSGQTNTFGYVEGSATTALFHNPFGLAFIPSTFDLVVADSYNYKLRQVSIADGSTALIAGDVQTVVDGVGSAAGFGTPLDVLFYPRDPSFVLVTDAVGHCLRRLEHATRNVTSLTLCSSTGGYQDGQLATAKFNVPHLLGTQAPMGYVYVAELGTNRVRRVDLEAGWVVTCVAGGGINPSPSSLQTALMPPTGITFGCRGGTLAMYVTGLHSITVVDMANSSGTGDCRPTSLNIGPVSLVAGNGTVPGAANGTGPSAAFNGPQAMLASYDRSMLFVADQTNHAVRRIDTRTHRVTPWVGLMGTAGTNDGIGTAARTNQPRDIIYHPTDPRLLVMLELTMVRTIAVDTAEVRHLCGGVTPGYVEGSATAARFQKPYGLLAHPDGEHVIVADTYNHRVRLVSLSTGATQLLAGSVANASTDGIGVGAAMFEPLGLAITTAEPRKLVVGEYSGCCLRSLDLDTRRVTTLSPCGTAGYRDGPLQTALFSRVYGLSSSPIEPASVFTADSLGHRIRRADMNVRWVMAVVGNGVGQWAPSASSSLTASLYVPLRTLFVCTPTGSLALYISFYHSIARVDLADGGCTTTATATTSCTPTGAATASNTPPGSATLTLSTTVSPSKLTASLSRTLSFAASSSLTRTGTRTPSLSASRTSSQTNSTSATRSYSASASAFVAVVRPVPYEPTTVSVAIDSTATGVTVVLGVIAPSVASMAGRQRAMRSILGCAANTQSAGDSDSGNDGIQPPGRDTNILQWSINVDAKGGSASSPDTVNAVRLHAGVVALAGLILAGAAVLVLVVTVIRAAIWRPLATPNNTLKRHIVGSLAWCRCPGSLSFVVAYTSGIAAQSTTAVLAAGAPSASAVAWLAVVSFVVSVLPVACGLAVYARCFRRTFYSTQGVKKSNEEEAPPPAARSCMQSAAATLMEPLCDWAPSVSIEPKRGHDLMRQYSLLFDAYTDRAPWFLAAEIGVVGVIGGILSQLLLVVGCAWAAWLTFAVFLLQVLLVCAFRPYAVRLELIGQLTVAVCQTVALLLAAIQTSFGIESVSAIAAAEWIATAASTIMTLVAVVAFAGAVRRFARSALRRRAVDSGPLLEAPTLSDLIPPAHAGDDLLATLLGGAHPAVPIQSDPLDDLLFDLALTSPPPLSHHEPSAAAAPRTPTAPTPRARVAHRGGGFNPLVGAYHDPDDAALHCSHLEIANLARGDSGDAARTFEPRSTLGTASNDFF
jgi:hypothetical protein